MKLSAICAAVMVVVATSATFPAFAASRYMYDTIDDVRVAPLLETSWGQGVRLVQGAYNYYTPKHYVCGCVATAGAQNVVIGNQCDIDFVPARTQLRSVR